MNLLKQKLAKAKAEAESYKKAAGRNANVSNGKNVSIIILYFSRSDNRVCVRCASDVNDVKTPDMRRRVIDAGQQTTTTVHDVEVHDSGEWVCVSLICKYILLFLLVGCSAATVDTTGCIECRTCCTIEYDNIDKSNGML